MTNNLIRPTQNRLQTFPWTVKSVAAADAAAISATKPNNSIGIEAVLPANFYACQGLFIKLVFVHDGTAPGRNVVGVTVQSDQTSTPIWTRTASVAGNTPTTMTYNGVAGSIVTSFAMDCSALRYSPGRNVVFVNFNSNISGTIKMFKLDFYYQVLGIR